MTWSSARALVLASIGLAACGGGDPATGAKAAGGSPPLVNGGAGGEGGAPTTHTTTHATTTTSASGGAGGAGGAPCPDGQALCDGACVDVLANDASCGACDAACAGGAHCAKGACVASKIEHVVLVVQENHTFDAYFGKYCQAAAGSAPACTKGRACCEAAPATEPSGASPIALDDAENFARDRDHTSDCELQQIHGGKMDQFVVGATGSDKCLGSGPDCASSYNFAIADEGTVGPYWVLADHGALADRYFQSVAGGSSSNDMYFAGARFVFRDNAKMPESVGSPVGCFWQGACVTGTPTTYSGETTIADLLVAAGKTFTVYADGWAHASSQAPDCETVPDDCPYSKYLHPVAAEACKLDASDVPFLYYAQWKDGAHVKDYVDLAKDLEAGTLPSFSYVKAREFRNEHPNVSTISDGAAFVSEVVAAIEGSSVKGSTLVLVTWDEGGGFYDHVAPPDAWPVKVDSDDAAGPVPYGTRVPMLAIGPFARQGEVSHVVMEHSSVVRFLEWNFLGPVGQLGARDGVVHNLGSLLDADRVGVAVPE
jgi:phospholipase C